MFVGMISKSAPLSVFTHQGPKEEFSQRILFSMLGWDAGKWPQSRRAPLTVRQSHTDFVCILVIFISLFEFGEAEHAQPD